jgi:HEAT repeat protein
VILLISASILTFTGCANKIASPNSGDYPETVNLENLKPESVRIIGHQLSSNLPETKVKAIEVIGELGLREFAPDIKIELTSNYMPVRFTAAIAVGDMQYQLAKPTLEKLVTVDDKMTKIAAAYALYKLGDKDKLEIIKKAAKNKDPQIRANATMLLGKSGDESVVDLLKWVQQSDNSDSQVRLQALEARAKLQDQTALDKLWAIIYSSYVEDRIIGITAMGDLGTQKTIEILITKLDDEIPEARLAAAQQLGRLGIKRGKSVVAEIFEENNTAGLEDKQKNRIFARSAFAIGEIDSPDLSGYLPKLLNSESKLVRLAAAKAVLQCLKR